MGGGGGCCIGNCCIGNFSCCIGNWPWKKPKSSSSGGRTSSYDSEKADLEATVKVQQALTDFRTETQGRSETFENDIIKQSRASLDEFIAELKTYNKIKYCNKKLDINISNIEREQRKTEDQIHGFITKKVSKRVSLDDDECLEILKLNPGAEKTKKLDEFYRKVLKEAVSELTNVIRDTMEKQTDVVEDRIQHRIDSIIDMCESKTVDFEKIQKLKTKDESKIEEEQIRLSNYVALCDLGLSILE